ncbi:hypothetical protein Raf01_28770 [Rugosimonospora africana]|uniref:Uncharacterized protein n=1 Tax=Rugosimonospora africana TaxID=556532 RepID=A0A8J3QS55_9ACTN|nr:hypothetical protein Raf01_28770 [Rugosimonospora africana]
MTFPDPVDVDRIVWAVNTLSRRRVDAVLDDIRKTSGHNAARQALAEATVIIIGRPNDYRPRHRRSSSRTINRAGVTS